MNNLTNESKYHDVDKDDLVDQLWEEFELYEQNVNEGPVADAAKGFAKSVGGVAAAGVKKAGSAALGAVKKGASAAKKEIAQKVTVRKLNSMWKKMGSPTDTGSIAKLLSDAGMSDEQIGTVAQQNKVELPAPQKSQGSDTAAQGTEQGSGTVAQGTDQQGSGTATQGGEAATGAKVDVKSLAAEIKKLPAADVKAIKDELTAELGKSGAGSQQSNTAQTKGEPQAKDTADQGANASDSGATAITFKPNQQVLFVSKAGKATPATVVGKSQDGDENKVSVKGAKGQTFNVSRDKLLDPKTKKPFKPGP